MFVVSPITETAAKAAGVAAGAASTDIKRNEIFESDPDWTLFKKIAVALCRVASKQPAALR